jgi:invasion protein IalB
VQISLTSIIVLTLLSTSAFGDQTAADAPEGHTVSAAVQANTRRLPGLATLISPGETVTSGDMIAINRPFDTWALMCDYRLSQNKRICVIEQVIGNELTHVRWRIATTVERKPLLVITVPTHMVLASGLRLGFAELEKTIPEAEWFCTAQTCITGFPFEGFLQAAIQSSQEVSFSFSVRSNDDKKTDVRLIGSMQGFSDAVKAATTDPFGKDIVQNAVAVAKPNDALSNQAESGKKRSTQPKSSKVERAPKPVAQEAKNTRKPSVGLY